MPADPGNPGVARGPLDELGFVVIPGAVPAASLGPLCRAYDAAVTSAKPEDVATGRTTTRISDFVNRGPEFDALYMFPPLLEACGRVLGRPFKLSTMHARTLRPHSAASELHVDFEPDAEGWTLVGFIFMVDEFRADNGATRFLPGSHRWSRNCAHEQGGVNLACGSAGSLIVFNGAVWHGHGANVSGQARRSIQGAFIRREGQRWIDLPARMLPETLARLSAHARYVLALELPVTM
jgi:ectoine hydroxylase-related dioxygenase (phytanoyl-CoA dioxygenase family)